MRIAWKADAGFFGSANANARPINLTENCPKVTLTSEIQKLIIAFQFFMLQKKKTAKSIPAQTAQDSSELTPAKPASQAIALTTTGSDFLVGELCPQDLGSPPRLSLVSPNSKIAGEVSPGQWAISDGVTAALGLGEKVEILPLSCHLWWLQDFNDRADGGPPIRFTSRQEVRDFGGRIEQNEPSDKPLFGRSMEVRCLIAYSGQVPNTFLQFPLGGRNYLFGLYECARSAYRVVGVGLTRMLLNHPDKKPYSQYWRLGVTTNENRTMGVRYYVPVLEVGKPTTESEQAELARLIQRRLPA